MSYFFKNPQAFDAMLSNPATLKAGLEIFNDPKEREKLSRVFQDPRFVQTMTQLFQDPNIMKNMRQFKQKIMDTPELSKQAKELEPRILEEISANPTLKLMLEDIATNGGQALSRVTRDPENLQKFWHSISNIVPVSGEKRTEGYMPNADDLDKLSSSLMKLKISVNNITGAP
uniref:STI1 domain-containing protein n=2 Tax=Lotharella globosa TaxID=91324 RepID=A0A7S3ZAR3_9EUKA|eukprot:CAMPEP_0167777276 /NCGR_PEP_ID=MMETSP0111_2-20121227/3602_1 /TAXON_ID=91324 /ORGANISM="Lotharella globosa, Strain CCCM811" /LENGTH=172 /DNA_ID=CAMNT_0007667439 /DNA_START=111 /DNA_END=629 /DNA_ORIENTATION=-